MSVPRADAVVVAIAEAFRGDGEILVSPVGPVPRMGAELARLTFEPDIVMTDGVASLVRGDLVEGWMPYRRVFDVVWAGKRHVMMGASQVDRHGNTNMAWIGDAAAPKVQLLGMRGGPGNTINHPTSYWIPRHSRRIFVPAVDCVSGVGYDRAAELGPVGSRFHEIRRVVTNLGVFDFETADRRMRIRSLHPGVALEEVVEATGFELAWDEGGPAETRAPTPAEQTLLDTVIDPEGARHGMVGQ